MNPRIATAAVGGIMLLLGLFGLLNPSGAMDLVGFAPERAASPAGAYGEARATYGGLFIAAGVYTILAGLDLERNRPLVFFVSLLWLGAAAGRLLGVVIDGNPGLFGLFSILFELACGGVLVWSSQLSASTPPGSGSFGT